VSCPSAVGCFAVGAGGAIVSTSTSGAAWSDARPAESTADIHGMSCYGPSNCYAAATDTLFATHDGGASWSTATLASGDELVSVSCPGASTCYAVGWPGAIYKTTNGGTSWTAMPNTFYGSDESLLGVSCASLTSCVVVGIFGKVLSTSDGTNWNQEASGTVGHLLAVSCPSTTSCVAVGTGGLALRRTSSVWHAYASGTSQTLLGVNCPTVNTCYAVGTAGVIRVTTNRGVTWAARTSGTTNTLQGIACLQPSYCVADGDFGTVLVTVDGATWKPRATPTFNSFSAAAFPDLDHSWLAGFGGTILANPSLIPSCTSVSITPDQASPGAVGAIVTLSAAAAGCPDPNPLYRFYLRSPSGVWSIVKDFSPASTFSWHTSASAPGTYLIEVWVKDAKSGFTYDAYALGTFTLQRLPCTAVNVQPAVPSPAVPSTTVNFAAVVSGCPQARYEWWVRDSTGVWRIAVPYSDAYAFAWNTTGLGLGTYEVGVWAKEQGSAKAYEAYGFVSYTLWNGSVGAACSAVNVGALPYSPAVIGTPVTVTATAVSCDTPEYKFWVRDSAGHWAVVKKYSSSNTFAWSTTSRPAGTYELGVWARQAGSAAAYAAYSFMTFTLTIGSNPFVCTSVSLAPLVPSPQAPGTAITFTINSLGCIGPDYEIWVLPPGGKWTVVHPYGFFNTFVWDTTGLSPGPWQIGVWAREAGSTSKYQAFAFLTFQLTFG
jgi:photosystem II stability/assembly factor-like uncharacterized protein